MEAVGLVGSRWWWKARVGAGWPGWVWFTLGLVWSGLVLSGLVLVLVRLAVGGGGEGGGGGFGESDSQHIRTCCSVSR